MSNLQSGTISCKCGRCEITVADKRAVQYFRCGCEDCRQGLEWARIKGGDKLEQLPHLYYIPADKHIFVTHIIALAAIKSK